MSGGVYSDQGEMAFMSANLSRDEAELASVLFISGYFGGIGASGTMLSAVTKLETSLNDDPVVSSAVSFAAWYCS